MKFIKYTSYLLLVLFECISLDGQAQSNNPKEADEMMIRIAQIEVETSDLDEYISLLKEEAEASVRLEAGVIAIFPMVQQDQPEEIRILEIYANKQAYEAHLKTPHFLHYKTSTQQMVKSIKLIDMSAIDRASMALMFSKITP